MQTTLNHILIVINMYSPLECYSKTEDFVKKILPQLSSNMENVYVILYACLNILINMMLKGTKIML
jgi:hypothetical protein